MQNESLKNKPVRSFGRIKSRKLRGEPQRLMDEVLPAITFKSLPSNKEIWLEIGFGGGEHLAHQATHNPKVFFIGCEPFINGMAKLLRDIEQINLRNVSVFNGDARELIDKLPSESINKVFILFPDPWPKARHHKRRIVEEGLICSLYRVLKTNGIIRLATDHLEYGTWMKEKFEANKAFKNILNTHDAPADHIETKYQKKGLASKSPVFLEYQKI